MVSAIFLKKKEYTVALLFVCFFSVRISRYPQATVDPQKVKVILMTHGKIKPLIDDITLS